MENFDDAVRARLKRLLRDHNQAKLARATGRSRNALTRYVQGARLPMSFGAALVDELGVNPAWLLRGDEPMYLADLPAAGGELGSELLGMMRALDHVSGLKLGALSGRRHARALRELSEALDRQGSLRDRLNRISAPVLRDLVEQAEEASARRKLDHAHALVEAAYRAQQFCDDRELAQRLLAVQAVLRHISQDTEEALRLQMSVFQGRMSLDARFEDVAEPAAALAQILRTNMYAARASRVARLGLSFSGPGDRGGRRWSVLVAQWVMASVELGELDGMASRLDEAVALCPPGVRPFVNVARTFLHLHCGTWSPREVAGGRPNTFAAAAMVLNAAYIADGAEVIESALSRARELMQAQMPLNRYVVTRGERVLRTMRRGELAPGALEEVEGRGVTVQFVARVHRAQVLRLVGDKRATDEMLHAQQCLDAFPAERTPNPFEVGLHLRNVLSGVAVDTRNKRLRELRRRTIETCRARVASGFGLLQTLLPE